MPAGRPGCRDNPAAVIIDNAPRAHDLSKGAPEREIAFQRQSTVNIDGKKPERVLSMTHRRPDALFLAICDRSPQGADRCNRMRVVVIIPIGDVQTFKRRPPMLDERSGIPRPAALDRLLRVLDCRLHVQDCVRATLPDQRIERIRDAISREANRHADGPSERTEEERGEQNFIFHVSFFQLNPGR